MTECVIVGRPRVGKTTLFVKLCAMYGKRVPGGIERCELSVARGRRGVTQFSLVDTIGLVPWIPSDPTKRSQLAQALQALASAGLVLHVVSAVSVERGFNGTESGIDLLLYRYASLHKRYLVACNKMDLPGAATGFKSLCKIVGTSSVVPIVAASGSGLKKLVQRLAGLV
ncbi:MAG: GTPase domain-containing protein [Bacillota bacterium]